MSYDIVFHIKAKKELFNIEIWYLEKNVNVHKKFVIAFFEMMDVLKRNPKIFAKVYNNKRKANLKKFPYSIVFFIEENKIFIISIFHHSRNPLIWEKRY